MVTGALRRLLELKPPDGGGTADRPHKAGHLMDQLTPDAPVSVAVRGHGGRLASQPTVKCHVCVTSKGRLTRDAGTPSSECQR